MQRISIRRTISINTVKAQSDVKCRTGNTNAGIWEWNSESCPPRDATAGLERCGGSSATGKGGVEGSGQGVGKMEWEINRLIRDEAWSIAQTCDLQTINGTVRCQSSTSRNAACHAALG